MKQCPFKWDAHVFGVNTVKIIKTRLSDIAKIMSKADHIHQIQKKNKHDISQNLLSSGLNTLYIYLSYSTPTFITSCYFHKNYNAL